MTVYDGELPIPEDWWKNHVGETVTIRYVMGLDDLIEVPGIEGMNDFLDNTTEVLLSDIRYAIGAPDRDDDLGDNALLIEATGVLEEF